MALAQTSCVQRTVFGEHCAPVSASPPELDGMKTMLASRDDLVDGESDRGIRHIDDRVDLPLLDPPPRDGDGHVGLLLMVAGNDLDLVAGDRTAGVLDRHLRREHRAGPHDVGGDTAHVGQDADAQRLLLAERMTGQRQQHGADERAARYRPLCHSLLLPSPRRTSPVSGPRVCLRESAGTIARECPCGQTLTPVRRRL